MIRKNGPWTIQATIQKYKNPWLQVDEDQVITPGGKPGIFGVVHLLPGISVLALDEEGFVYLTKEFRYAIEQESVEAVSGGIDGNEAPLRCAQRELKEEAGIIAKEWINLGVINPFTSTVLSPANLFLARGLEFTESNREETEVITIVKVKFEEAVRMVLESKITHGPSCVLILKAKEFLEKEKMNSKK